MSTRRPPYLSALGSLILIVPAVSPRGADLIAGYHVVTFDRRGQWTSGGVEPVTLTEAMAARTRLFADHRRLAKERAARRRKPK